MRHCDKEKGKEKCNNRTVVVAVVVVVAITKV